MNKKNEWILCIWRHFFFLSFVTNWKLRGGKDRCVSHGTVRWQEYKVFKTYWRCHWYFFLVEVFIRFVRWQYWHWHIMFIVYEVFIEKWRKETLLAIFFFSWERGEAAHVPHTSKRFSSTDCRPMIVIPHCVRSTVAFVCVGIKCISSNLLYINLIKWLLGQRQIARGAITKKTTASNQTDPMILSCLWTWWELSLHTANTSCAMHAWNDCEQTDLITCAAVIPICAQMRTPKPIYLHCACKA